MVNRIRRFELEPVRRRQIHKQGVSKMIFTTSDGEKLLITNSGLDAILPLIRSDSACRQISNHLWGVYTPSAQKTGPIFVPLLTGTKEACEAAIKEYGGQS